MMWRSKPPRKIVLCGPCGAGKTNLLSALENGGGISNVETSPLSEKAFSFPPEAGKEEEEEEGGTTKYVNVVDVPGRLAPKKLPELLPNAAGVVFVVDAVNFVTRLAQVTELLDDVLSVVEKKDVPAVMICRNKAEKFTYNTDFVLRQLEKEIDKLRATGSGVSDEAFSFSNRVVSIGRASAFAGQLVEVKGFIRGVARAEYWGKYMCSQF